MDLVIGVGFIFTDDLTELAHEYPDVHFAGVDYALKTDAAGNVVPPPPNLAALKFREEEGSFLVGALAALVGGSKRVGFVGGMDLPPIHKFEAGGPARGGQEKIKAETLPARIRAPTRRGAPMGGRSSHALVGPPPPPRPPADD